MTLAVAVHILVIDIFIHLSEILISVAIIGLFSVPDDVIHSAFLLVKVSPLFFSQLEKTLDVSVETHWDTTELSVMTVFLNIKQFIPLSVLDDPNIVSLLCSLTSSINGVYSYVLSFVCLTRVDHYRDMDILVDCYLP